MRNLGLWSEAPSVLRKTRRYQAAAGERSRRLRSVSAPYGENITITFTKTKLALSLLVVALVIPATAFATHVFDDVPDDAFYADPVEWAFDISITTGKSATSFAPLDNVTRGESVTFFKRYNDNVVEVADASNSAATEAAQAAADTAQADADAAQVAADTNAADIDALMLAVEPLVNNVSASAAGEQHEVVGTTDEIIRSISPTPPADGAVIVNSSMYWHAPTAALGAQCAITTGSTVDTTHLQVVEMDGVGTDFAPLSGTLAFEVTENVLLTVDLVCDTTSGEAAADDSALTAIFAPG
jgi:hypothetical protein